MPQTSRSALHSIPFSELNSEEVQEIISRPPNWLVSWGITIFFGIMLLLALGTWQIRYPELTTVPLTLTSIDVPRAVVVRSEGKLTKLLVKDGQQVLQGEAVAYLESTADHEHVIRLTGAIEQLGQMISDNRWASVPHFKMGHEMQLGELQRDFHTFNLQFIELKSFLAGGFYLKKQQLLSIERKDLSVLGKMIAEQLALQRKDYELAKNDFEGQQKLYESGSISALQYKREKAKLLSLDISLKNLGSLIVQNHSAQIANQKELLELENSIEEHRVRFLQSLQTLKSSFDNWRRKYILTAPVTGNVSFLVPCHEQQYLSMGQELMTIEPFKSTVQGLVKIPQANFGKLKEGQTVHIKLDGFPYQEYGTVEGILGKLSRIPGKDGTYWGYVVLPNQLKTRYGHSLSYRNGLKGRAEIITADRRLAERLIATFQNL